MNNLKKTCAVVIPTLNEGKNIQQILSTLLSKPLISFIIIVDDGSIDGTRETIKEIQKLENRIHLIERSGQKSFAHSYIEGFKYAFDLDVDIVIQMDADGSHNHEDISRFLETLNEFDLIIGSRYTQGGKIENWGFFRSFISRAGNLYTRIILQIPIKDMTTGFNAWRASVLRNINFKTIKCDGYAFQIYLKWNAWQQGCRIKEIPITFKQREWGCSKFHSGMILESIIKVIRMRFMQN